jgi:hypothetical protein
VIDDALEIDMIFGQIIRDCRQQKCQMRIRKYEKDSINQLLSGEFMEFSKNLI